MAKALPDHPWNRAFVEWMRDTGQTYVSVAFRCSVSAVSVFHWTRNSRPRPLARQIIEQMSGGKVPANLADVAHAS